MLSKYALTKLQKNVVKLHKAGATKQKIGRLINSVIVPQQQAGAKSAKIKHANIDEVFVNIENRQGLTKNDIKKFKTALYKKLDSGKKKNLGFGNFQKIKNSNINKLIDNVSFFGVKNFVTCLVVYEFQDIKTGELFFSSIQIPKEVTTKKELKEFVLMQYENYMNQQYTDSARNLQTSKLRLLNISFRFFFKKRKKVKK